MDFSRTLYEHGPSLERVKDKQRNRVFTYVMGFVTSKICKHRVAHLDLYSGSRCHCDNTESVRFIILMRNCHGMITECSHYYDILTNLI